MPDPSPTLEAQSLRKVFRGSRQRHFVAVDDVSFALAPNSSLAIVGESGSGKTTVARMLVGLERPTSGQITVHGHELAARRQARRRVRHGRDIQIVFQDPYTSLDPRQTVGACLSEVLWTRFRDPKDIRQRRVAALLQQVGLSEHHAARLPRALSGGQRQRVAIARALAAEPAILVLDEPVSALDVSIQAQVLNLLSQLREQTRISYVFISHDLSVVRQVSDEILVMKRGQVVERGRTPEVLGDPQHPYTRRLLDAVPRAGWRPRSFRASQAS
jgi:ABC-type oligopeptide transport system ATPase subunit